jgi:hypothetical protein
MRRARAGRRGGGGLEPAALQGRSLPAPSLSLPGRLAAQRLEPRHGGSIGELVGWLPVQAQDGRAAELAVRARMRGVTAGDVEAARVRERSIVRTWAMRGTLHLVATEDVGWLLGLFGERYLAANARRRAQLGLDEAATERGVRVVRELLGERGPSTRREVAAALAVAGVAHAGQATIHVLYAAALRGEVCYGPYRGREETFVLLADWVRPGRAWSREAALGELARRYARAHWPADGADFAHWSGLSAAEARAGWARVGAVAEPEAGGRSVRLLPAFDPYMLGWRDRSFAVPAALAKRVHPGGGMILPTVVVDGVVVGTWRLRGGEAVVEAVEAVDGLEGEVADVRRFLG